MRNVMLAVAALALSASLARADDDALPLPPILKKVVEPETTAPPPAAPAKPAATVEPATNGATTGIARVIDPDAAAPAAPAAEAPRAYTVRSGDTLTAIAERNGVTLDALLAANPSIKNPNAIDVGQVIALPGSAPAPAAPASAPAPSPSKADAALAWAKRQPGSAFYLRCLGLVNQSFQAAGDDQPELHASYARAAFDRFAAEGRVQQGPAPRGAIVFWNWTGNVDGVRKNWGHVAISNGDGTVVSSPVRSGGPVEKAIPATTFGTPIGWVMPR